MNAVRAVPIVLSKGHDADPLTVLVPLLSTVDPLRLLVLRLDMAADILAVDLDRSPETHLRPAQADGFPDLGQQHPCGLVLDGELSGEVGGQIAGHEHLDTKDRPIAAGAAGWSAGYSYRSRHHGIALHAGGPESIGRSGDG